jgi:hypothetical protein
MNRLFVKIFLSFWGIAIAVATIMYSTSGYFKEDIEHPTPWELQLAAKSMLERSAEMLYQQNLPVC